MAKVLVIEDDVTMRRMIHRTLEHEGHQVIEAGNGAEGMRRFHAEAPDVVVTDIIMPEQEGIQTIREIRGGGSKVGIVAISGGGIGEGSLYLTIAGELGADAVLSKPFRPAELVAQVDALLGRGAG